MSRNTQMNRIGVHLHPEDIARIRAAVASIGCSYAVFATEAVARYLSRCEEAEGARAFRDPQRVKTFALPARFARLLERSVLRTGRSRASLLQECLKRLFEDDPNLQTLIDRPSAPVEPTTMVGIHMGAIERAAINQSALKIGCPLGQLAGWAVRRYVEHCQAEPQRSLRALMGFCVQRPTSDKIEMAARTSARTHADLLAECLKCLLADPVALRAVPAVRLLAHWRARGRSGQSRLIGGARAI